MSIKNIIFDVGYVLFQYRWDDLLLDCGLSEEDAKRVKEYLYDDPEEVWSRYDKGLADREDVIAAFCEKYPADAKTLTFVFRHPEYMHVPRPAIWEKVHELKLKGYQLYILSNYPEDLFQIHTQYADFMQDMDGAVISYMVGKGKPDREIYEALLNKYQLTPQECVFFDDKAENIEGAKAVGIEGIQVISQEQLIESINSFLQ